MRKSPARGMTLVELLVAVSIVAILSLAITTMLAGANNTNKYVLAETDALSQVELAYRRILHNLRTASAMTTPSNGTTTNTLVVTTQPDASNGNASYTVTYAITGGNLTEVDSRYGASPAVLVTQVATFQITRIATAPTQVLVRIVSNTKPAVVRETVVTCRNL